MSRIGCVRCGRSREHCTCPTFASMALPEGKTCADCVHFKRTCVWLISYTGRETSCDWYPIRFVPIQSPENHQESTKGAQGGQDDGH